MNFWELIAGGSFLTFLVGIVLVGVIVFALNVVDSIERVKIAKYESYAARAGFDYDLYEFARWLSDQEYLDDAYSDLVDKYIETHN